MTTQPAPAAGRAASGGRSRGRRISVPVVIFAVALVACLGYIVYVVRAVEDRQIELLSFGFIALGLTFVAIALACVFGMWRAASRAEGGRSFGLALVGGLSGLAAIGSFSVAALMLMVLNS